MRMSTEQFNREAGWRDQNIELEEKLMEKSNELQAWRSLGKNLLKYPQVNICVTFSLLSFFLFFRLWHDSVA